MKTKPAYHTALVAANITNWWNGSDAVNMLHGIARTRLEHVRQNFRNELKTTTKYYTDFEG